MKIRELLLESYTVASRKFVDQGGDLAEVRELLGKFRDLNTRQLIKGEDRDLTSWIRKGWSEFKEFVTSSSSRPSNKETKKVNKSESVQLFKDENWTVVLPLSTKAAQAYGKGTRWCISATESHNYFEDYFFGDQILLFLFLNKHHKLAATWHTSLESQFFDQDDKQITQNEFEEITGFNYIDEELSDWAAECRTEVKQAQEIYVATKTQREIEEALKSPYNAFMYAVSKDQGRWPEGESLIATEPHASYRYANEVLNGKRFPAGEDAICTDTSTAYVYARKILKKPWKKAEQAILNELKTTSNIENYDSSETASNYACNVLNNRWPAAEQILMSRLPQSFDACCDYADRLEKFGKKWPEFSKYVREYYANLPTKDVKDAFLYKLNIYWSYEAVRISNGS